jgi:predicted  nucleic acid-binding Zn-ribbon protein
MTSRTVAARLTEAQLGQLDRVCARYHLTTTEYFRTVLEHETRLDELRAEQAQLEAHLSTQRHQLEAVTRECATAAQQLTTCQPELEALAQWRRTGLRVDDLQRLFAVLDRAGVDAAEFPSRLEQYGDLTAAVASLQDRQQQLQSAVAGLEAKQRTLQQACKAVEATTQSALQRIAHQAAEQVEVAGTTARQTVQTAGSELVQELQRLAPALVQATQGYAEVFARARLLERDLAIVQCLHQMGEVSTAAAVPGPVAALLAQRLLCWLQARRSDKPDSWQQLRYGLWVRSLQEMVVELTKASPAAE